MVRHNGSIVLTAFDMNIRAPNRPRNSSRHTNHGVLQSGLAIKDMLQIGMDGTNVNRKILQLNPKAAYRRIQY